MSPPDLQDIWTGKHLLRTRTKGGAQSLLLLYFRGEEVLWSLMCVSGWGGGLLLSGCSLDAVCSTLHGVYSILFPGRIPAHSAD